MDHFSTHTAGGRRWLLVRAEDYPLPAWYGVKELP